MIKNPNIRKILNISVCFVWILLLSFIIFADPAHNHEVVDSSGFIISSSEGICFRYNSFLTWHLGISDLIIFLCYVLIPLGLLQSIKLLPRNLARPLKIYTILLGLFIITCGLTHLMNILLLFYPIWYTAVFVNWVCAIASTVATVYLWFYARPTLKEIATNLKDLLLIRDSIKRLNELERIVESQNTDELTLESIRYQIKLIRMNLNTLQTFQQSVQQDFDTEQ